jgi:ABC-2 type transport system ATP-binding protein
MSSPLPVPVEPATRVGPPPSLQPSLAVAGVTHSFGDAVVLDELSFGVQPGLVTGLLGPNGAGKTTLMRVMLGIIEPLRGTVLLHGSPARGEDQRRWGYMPQERGLYPAMRAGEQVVYFARLHGFSRHDADTQARAVLAELGLEDGWNDRTDHLSGGLQQRLQLATALVHDPEVVVLDEPFAGLDPVAVDALSDSLRQRAGRGATVLFSSHQLDLVQDLCEDIVMVDHGRLVLAGEVASLRAASGRRQLRLHLDTADRGWLARFPGVLVVNDQADELRLGIPPEVDPLAVLDGARASGGHVSDFGLDLPTLSELFLKAVRDDDERRRTVT